MARNPFSGTISSKKSFLASSNRQDPCPHGNGTKIGNEQEFVVFCLTSFTGTELSSAPASSLRTCADRCEDFHSPRCDGIQYQLDSTCVLLSNIDPNENSVSIFAGSALGLLPQPSPSSNCRELGTITTVDGKSFQPQCGFVSNGNDIEQQFQKTYTDCLNACAGRRSCGGVSYNADQSAGFKNCYLKEAFQPNQLQASNLFDSALITDNTNISSATGTPTASLFSIIATTTPSTTASTVPLIIPATVPSMLIFTPGVISAPTSSATTETPASPTSSIASSTTTPTQDSTAFSSATILMPTPSASYSREAASLSSKQTIAHTKALVAVPVVGGVAALALIAGFLSYFLRRRSRTSLGKLPPPGKTGIGCDSHRSVGKRPSVGEVWSSSVSMSAASSTTAVSEEETYSGKATDKIAASRHLTLESIIIGYRPSVSADFKGPSLPR